MAATSLPCNAIHLGCAWTKVEEEKMSLYTSLAISDGKPVASEMQKSEEHHFLQRLFHVSDNKTLLTRHSSNQMIHVL